MSRPTIREISRSYADGSGDPVETVSRALDRIEKTNPRTRWFISILRDLAVASAGASAKRHYSGESLGPLDGVPIAVKDLLYIEGVKCTAGSKILAENVAPYDAPVVRMLKEAGAVIVGTTNLHEFACGVTSDNPHFGTVRNPWGFEHVAGGSSGGSAATVSSGQVPGSIGTDTAGSVRIPAALCGTLGVKPTYGRISRLGVIPLASSLDTVGVFTNSAWDAAVMLNQISGHEGDDVTTTDVPVPDYTGELEKGADRMRVGVPQRYFHDLIDQEVESNFQEFLSKLKEVGCVVVEMDLDGIDDVYGLWLPIRRAEATAFHLKWLDECPGLYGADVLKALQAGRDLKAVDYVAAVNARPSMIEKFLLSMKGIDALAVPGTCVPAPRIGQDKVGVSGKETEVYHALNRMTLPFNYVGFPSVSIPSGLVKGLPVGVQLVSRLFEESHVLRLASALERAFPFPAPPEQP